MAEFWEETIQLLQPPDITRQLVTKPQLKPELLQKIPFKFLLDVIVAVLKKTKFAPGMFTKEEMDRKWEGYDKDKAGKDVSNQNKRKFLADILSVVSIALNEPIACDVKEVIKGKDAAGANRLLQMLAKAADGLQLDGVEALRVHQSRGEAQVETAALRPESRRAHKPAPVRSAADTPADLGNLQEVPAAVDQHRGSSTGHSQSGGPMGEDNLSPADPTTADTHAAAANFAGVDMDPAEQSAPFSGTEPPVSVEAINEVQPVSEPHQQQDSASHVLSNPKEVAEPESKINGAKSGSGSLMEPAAQLAAPTPQRPMTAKKAPPRTISPAPEPQRGRLCPPQEQVGTTRPRQAVHVYREELALEDESIDVVESAPVTLQKEQESHGMLVSEMFKVMGSAEAAQGGILEGEGPLDSGINLGRSKRTKKRSSGRVDTSAVRDAVESLVHKIAPLARSMDYLQEDKENMEKELQVWRSEGQLWGKQLSEELLQAKVEHDTQEISLLDEDIAKKHAQIRQTKRQIIKNEDRLMSVMSLTIGDE